ncbi:MAG: 30S ribosomal protein S19 [Candidatus Zambryskibacteria bacterium]|nr:30S ribosomal protein S19 [Candidatus Zambryskibacteria bacterium]
MTRSSKKGPYVDDRLLKKIEGKKPIETGVIKTWSRACVISPEMIGFNFGVHNGKTHLEVLVSEDMVGHRLGEFSPTKKFIKHGGKMQKEMEQKKKEGEIASAQAAKAPAEAVAKK